MACNMHCLEVSKKVQYVPVAQRSSKLQLTKVGVNFLIETDYILNNWLSKILLYLEQVTYNFFFENPNQFLLWVKRVRA